MKQPPAIIVQLIHMEGPLKGQIQEFNLPEIVIGRSPACQVCFPRDLAIVSRVHARIVREGNRFMLMDQSTNGTFVNGKQVKEAILKDGDILLFAEGGPKVSFLTQAMVQTTAQAAAQATEGASDAPVSAEPAVFSAPAASAPVRGEFPPLAPMPHSQQPVGGPQPVPAMSMNFPSPQARPSDDMEIQPVKKPLVIQYGPTLQSYNGLPITIGRGAQCDFRLDHPAVLECHAQIFYCRDQYWIKDLTGKNLVRINGRSVEGQEMLEPDQCLSLSAQGPDFRFLGGGRLAEIEPATPGESQSPPHPECGDVRPGAPQGNAVKQIGAMMKKILKR